MSPDPVSVFICQKHVVGADGHEPGVADFHLVVKLDQTLRLAPVLWAIPTPAEHQDQGIWPCRSESLRRLARVIGQLIIGEYRASYNICSHAA
jgi:hypothetical protein